MSDSENIRNWLIFAFEEPIDRINESYYFDKRDNQFFSIFITDYLFLNDINSSVDTPYTRPEMDILYDRIGRIDKQDTLILEIPRLNVIERKQMISEFLTSNCRNLSPEDLEKIVSNETGKNTFKISSEFNDDILNKWLAHKADQVLYKAESFLNLNNIDMESASLWTDKKVTTIEYNLKTEPTKKSKSWWKFW